jgi:hypothetical protein
LGSSSGSSRWACAVRIAASDGAFNSAAPRFRPSSRSRRATLKN